MDKRIVLGSGSAGRAKLLAGICPNFSIIRPVVEEPKSGFNSPRNQVAWTSWIKAEDVASRTDNAIIICADTIGWLNQKPLMKPESRQDAFEMLKNMSGMVHELWTGVVLWDKPSNEQICWQEQSLVKFKSVSDQELHEYLDTRPWKDHSGAYAIEESNDPWVSLVEGSLSNVIGLPVESLQRNLIRMTGLKYPANK